MALQNGVKNELTKEKGSKRISWRGGGIYETTSGKAALNAGV